eukprot:jgi/Mesvir1/17473/Mv08747-RA.1
MAGVRGTSSSVGVPGDRTTQDINASDQSHQAPLARMPPPQQARGMPPQRQAVVLPQVGDVPPPALDVSRVNQLDAARLDVELTEMLRDQFLSVFSVFQPATIARLRPELMAALEFLIFHFSVWRDRPTPGNALMNLRYRDERKSGADAAGRTGLGGPPLTRLQKLLWGVCHIGGRYLWLRLNRMSVFQDVNSPEGGYGDESGDDNDSSRAVPPRRWLAPHTLRWLWFAMQRAEATYKCLSIANLIVFLYEGKYPNVVDRLLRARLVYQKASVTRALSFEYMNRQLVWNEFSEVLLFILPLVSLDSLKRTIFRRWLKQGIYPASSSSGTADDDKNTPCGICNSKPILVPFRALPCQHLFCYYCLRSNCQAARTFRCPVCQVPVRAMRRLRRVQALPRRADDS